MIGTALILGGLMPAAIAAPALAVSADIVISEVYGGGGNTGAVYTHDYVELYNRGAAAVSLGGNSIQYTSATGTGNFGANTGQSTELPDVTLAPGQYYLVKEAAGAGNGSALPLANLEDPTPIAIAAAGGKIAYVTGTAPLGCNGSSTPCSATQLARIVDLLGWGSANFFETAAAPATTNSTAAIRANGGATDTDNNSSDFAAGAPDPDSSAVPPDAAPSVASVVPADQASDVDETSNIEITFSEPVTVSGTWFSLMCGATTHAALASGGPTVYTLDPAVNFAEGASCTLTVFAAGIADNDTNDPPQNMAADFTSSFSTGDVCEATFTPIYEIQGSGNAAATTGEVTTAGVVVGDFEGPITSGLQGFHIQDPAGDGNAATSDGLFIFTGDTDNGVAVGDYVRISGVARERFNQTVIQGANDNNTPLASAGIVTCGTATVPTPADITMPLESDTYLERFEGMKVRFPEALVIAEYFDYDRFGEIVLAEPLAGEDRPFTGTAIDEPGAAANARTAANLLRRITLDDGLAGQNPSFTRHPNGEAFTVSNRFRGGDTVANATGVLGFDFSRYRIQPTAPADYTPVNPRPASPDPVGGTLRAAAMNTLNFFLTLDTTSSDSGPGPCGGNANLDCRGADASQPDEFTRQRDKLLAALAGLDADIIGLNEIENTPGVDPLGDPTRGIVAGLNDLGAGPYDSIDTGVIGTDAIRVGLIYRSDIVAPVGPYKILTSTVDPRFNDGRSRPVLAQTFEELATGARITVAVNHLKSKGSACGAGDDDTTNGQGNCNGSRASAAAALVDWLQSDPTGSGDRDYLILGDLNSYAQEQPIDIIKAGSDGTVGTADDYTNLIAKYQGTYAHSYVFDGQAGYLDHALASQTLVGQVTGATDWHINSDEPDIVDYDTSFKSPSQEATYQPNAYRSSDHDPVIVGLDLLNFEFEGFQDPIVNPPLVNSINAGAAVPVKFELSGDLGLDVVFGSPSVTQFNCTLGAGAAMGDATTAGRSLVQYDAATNTYTYVWKTDKKDYVDTCRTFELTLDDGTYRQVLFSFTK
jgi:predicted extracellular nuclease